MGPKDAINDIPIPALVMGGGILCALAVCALIVRKAPARTKAMEKWGGIAGAWCVVIGYTIAHHKIVGRQYLSPNMGMTTEHWMPWIAALGALLATLQVCWRAPLWARVVSRGALAALISAAMLVPLIRSEWLEWFVWNEKDAGLWFAGGAVGVAWISVCMTMLAKRTPAWSAWLTMSAVLGAMAPSLVFWGVAQDGRLMGVLAAMCGSVFVVCAVTKRKSFGVPIAMALGAVAGALTLHAAANGESLNYWSLGLCLAVPIVWMAAESGVLKMFGDRGGWGRVALRVVLPVLVGGLAAWIAYEPSDYAGLGY